MPVRTRDLYDILGKTNLSIGAYKIKKITNDLSPRALPKTGDLVVVEGLNCPRGLENNAISIRDIPDTSSWDVWMPTYPFYIGQIVSFWKDDTQYDFQIQFSDHDDPTIGKFVLINKQKTERQPGRVYRTTKNGKKTN